MLTMFGLTSRGVSVFGCEFDRYGRMWEEEVVCFSVAGWRGCHTGLPDPKSGSVNGCEFGCEFGESPLLPQKGTICCVCSFVCSQFLNKS